jgi:ribulose-5-phosphate 4-epimerase/fuculose-1-phosphate aldolase
VEPPGLPDLNATIVLACRVLTHLGLLDYLGHISARVPGGRLVITPRGHAVGGLQSLTAADLLVIDADGQAQGSHPVPSEVFIHTEIFRARPDVQSIVHTHQPMAVAFAIAGRPMAPVHITGCELLDPPPPTYDSPNLVNTVEKGREVAAALGPHHLLLLRGHGVVSAGRSIQEAVLAAILLEQQAWHHYRALQIGEVRALSPEEIRQHRADLARARQTGGEAGAWRYFASLVEASREDIDE